MQRRIGKVKRSGDSDTDTNLHKFSAPVPKFLKGHKFSFGKVLEKFWKSSGKPNLDKSRICYRFVKDFLKGNNYLYSFV